MKAELIEKTRVIHASNIVISLITYEMPTTRLTPIENGRNQGFDHPRLRSIAGFHNVPDGIEEKSYTRERFASLRLGYLFVARLIRSATTNIFVLDYECHISKPLERGFERKTTLME
jgi:hypothetical protein